MEDKYHQVCIIDRIKELLGMNVKEPTLEERGSPELMKEGEKSG